MKHHDSLRSRAIDRGSGSRATLLVGLLLAIAAALRLGHLWSVREAPFVASLVMDSLEYHLWALELASGRWLGSDAFFQAPLYPYLIGVLYTLFDARPAAIYLFQIVMAVVAIYALYRCGCELEGRRLGLVAAGLTTATGILVFHDVQLLKESLAVSLTAILLWWLVRLRRKPGVGGWLGAGALLGLLVGLRENALLLFPLVLLLPWLAPAATGNSRRFRPQVAGLALIGGVALALAPWAVRNQAVAGEQLLTTYQGGVNFYIGNHPGADGTYRPLVPGKQVPALEREEPRRLAESALGRSLSASEVSRYWLRQALSWAAEEPGEFARLQLRKVGLFWRFYEQPDAVDYYWMRQRSLPLRLAFVELGALALLAVPGLWLVRRRMVEWAPVLLLIGGWMIATVLFFVFSRYRLPVIPPLALLAAVPLVRLLERPRDRKQGWISLLGLGGVLMAFLFPHLLGHEPRLDLVHHNLGKVAEQEGRVADARRHYYASLEANPRQLLPLMNLGTLAARQGELRVALALYREALTVETGSDDLWANLGATHLAMGEAEEAAAALERALALNPTHLEAQHSMALLAERSGQLEEARRWNRRVLATDPAHGPARRQAERLQKIHQPPEPLAPKEGGG
jgi:4-amino-4-deoxy-L-arabinose transferase-like glycosyltransferase